MRDLSRHGSHKPSKDCGVKPPKTKALTGQRTPNTRLPCNQNEQQTVVSSREIH